MSVLNNPLLLGFLGGGEPAVEGVSRSVRFNSADTAFLNRTPASAGDRKTWTWAGWVKRAALQDNFSCLFDAGGAGTNNNFRFDSNDFLNFILFDGSTQLINIQPTQVFRDYSAWYHLVLAYDSDNSTESDRVRLYVNGTRVTAFSNAIYPTQGTESYINSTNQHRIGGAVTSSDRFLDGYLADIYFIDGQALDPTRFGEYDDNGIWQPIEFLIDANPGYAPVQGVGDDPDAMFDLDVNSGTQGAVESALTWAGSINFGTGKYYLILDAYGFSSQGPSSATLTVNGTDYTTNYSTIRSNTDIHNQVIGNGGTFISTADGRRTNLTPSITNATLTDITAAATGGGFKNEFYAVVFVPDGVGDTDFANHIVVNNTTTYGRNGFNLDFSDNSSEAALGTDTSGNNNTWTVNNFSVTPGVNNDSVVDVPVNGTETDTGVGGQVRSNYCTLNPLTNGGNNAPQNGNLEWVGEAGKSVTGTLGVSSGKWYWEVFTNDRGPYIGVTRGDADIRDTVPGKTSNSYAIQEVSERQDIVIIVKTIKWNNDVRSDYTGAMQDRWIGVALDLDAGTLGFYYNGDFRGIAFSNLPAGTYFPAAGNTKKQTYNFGQRPFAYAAPSGYKALCTANLPTSTIAKGSDYFDTTLYTGNGGTQAIGGLDFQPDLVWIKSRSNSGLGHVLNDAIRGAGRLVSSSSSAAEAGNPGDFISSFDSNGFTVNTNFNGGSNGSTNANNQTFAAWTWDAGDSTVPNTDGTIASQVRANPNAGFSIVTWTPQATAGTVGHGLGIKPAMIITKDRDNANNWYTYHSAIGRWRFLLLNLANALGENSSIFSNNPTATVFDQGTAFTSTNGYGKQVCYCFAPIEGYSAFSRYTGNGSADGTFIYTGFRPRWIMTKRADNTGNWVIIDTAREGYNVDNNPLFPNLFDSESTADIADILSNGFKIRTTDVTVNANGERYIYAAFAENPFALNARAR